MFFCLSIRRPPRATRTDTRLPSTTRFRAAADDMALGRNPLADRVAAHAGSDLDDAADEFMAEHQPGLDRALAPLVPQVDVQVGAADGGFLELDQDLVRARLRDRDLLHPDALGRFALDQRLHGRGNLRGLAGQWRHGVAWRPGGTEKRRAGKG